MSTKEPEVDFTWLQFFMQKAGISEPLLKFAFRCPNCRRYFILSEMIESFSDTSEATCIECGEPIKAIDLFQTIKRIIGYDDYYRER